MMDSGCNSHLLPLDDSTILYLEKNFPASRYAWSVIIGSGFGITTPKLEIQDF